MQRQSPTSSTHPQKSGQWTMNRSYWTPPATPRKPSLHNHDLNHVINQRRLQRFHSPHQLPSDHCSSDEAKSHRKYAHRESVSSSSICNQGSESGAYGCYVGPASEVNRCSTPVKFSDLNLSPETMFLIKEHAKTVASINSISRRLEEIELKVDNIQKSLYDRNSSFMDNKMKSDTNGAVPHVLSDDSGGEYSRTTTGTTTDEDELLSLLDQIAKCSHQIQQTQQAHNYQSQVLNSNILGRSCQPSGSSMPGMYMSSPPSLSQGMTNSQPQKQQSLSALLFEPNVERFLSNLDQLMDDPKHSSGGVPEAATVTHASAPPAELPIARQIERARHLVARKEQDGIKSQLKLVDEWYANHSRDRVHPQVPQAKSSSSRADQRYLEIFDQGFRL